MSDKAHKADKARTEARIEDILRILLDGAQPQSGDVARYVLAAQSEEGPWKLLNGEKPLAERTIRRYVAAALERLADISSEDRGKLLNRHLALRRSLFARAVAAGELSVALRVLDSEAELLGLNKLDLETRLADLERRLAQQEAKQGGSKQQTTGRLRA